MSITRPTRESRDRRGLAGISVMATGDYAALRARYGDHLVDGIAGEGVLVDSIRVARPAMPDRTVIAGAPGAAVPPDGSGPPSDARASFDDGDLVLHSVQVADPCVEFTRFCLRLPASDSVGDDVSRGLDDLGGGARGYKMVAEREWVLRRGDLLLIDLARANPKNGHSGGAGALYRRSGPCFPAACVLLQPPVPLHRAPAPGLAEAPTLPAP